MRAAALISESIGDWLEQCSTPLVVALDGHGAAGKSTIARRVRVGPSLSVVHVDDFWRVSGERDPQEPRSPQPLSAYYDWARLRGQALRPLIHGQTVEFVAVDPDTERLSVRTVAPASVIIVEGVCAAGPALADMVNRTVLVRTAAPVRLARLRARVRPEDWDHAWLDAERAYLSSLGNDSFDLVVPGSDDD